MAIHYIFMSVLHTIKAVWTLFHEPMRGDGPPLVLSTLQSNLCSARHQSILPQVENEFTHHANSISGSGANVDKMPHRYIEEGPPRQHAISEDGVKKGELCSLLTLFLICFLSILTYFFSKFEKKAKNCQCAAFHVTAYQWWELAVGGEQRYPE